MKRVVADLKERHPDAQVFGFSEQTKAGVRAIVGVFPGTHVWDSDKGCWRPIKVKASP
jgi:hypothetical protein